MLSLDKLGINEKGIIKDILCSEKFKNRLFDMGINKDEEIKCIMVSPSKLIKAYLVKNTVIAIRNKDSNNILVEVCHEDCFNRKS